MTGMALGLVMAMSSVAQVSGQGTPADVMSQSSLRAQALTAIKRGDYTTAIQAGDALLREYPQDASAARRAGDIFLRAGKVADSVRQFNRYLKMNPGAEPDLWQRGIALFFVGEYAKAADQFVKHREVNPSDVENAAWHFVCVAKRDSFEQAEKELLPAPGDRRIPMSEVFDLLAGGDENEITKAIEALPEGSAEWAEAAFYGDLYRGLYADAKGQADRARRYMDRAASRAPSHYMGDVAKLYAVSLEE